MGILGKLLDSNEKQIAKYKPLVDSINRLEPDLEKLSSEQVINKTRAWQSELAKLPDKEHEKYLETILPEAFGLVREAAKHTLGQRHYDVQLMAGIALHEGKIAEQKTGEGKTLTATLPLYLNSLTGKGVHLVTPNDYLSRHGAGWMGQVYNYLGVTVGVIMQERAFVYDAGYESSEFKDDYTKHLREVTRQQAYQCDIVYGTNHEFGFDYLRDNMVRGLTEMVQTCPRGDWGSHQFGIVDEVDSILIDFARTPLIISTNAAQPTARYQQADKIVKQLIRDQDYEVDEKFRSSALTDLGIRRVEKMLGVSHLYEEDFEMVHLLEQSLSARALHEKDKDYVVKDGKVVIVDQFTGRLLPSNRFSQGLHQAIEAKEGVEIQQESKTLAEISYQNYFRMYDKLAGMTGTAVTEAEEFYKIYKLDVVVIPTNKPTLRKDFNDLVYKTEAGKFKAAADDIAERHAAGQPVLVGTTSVEKSQMLHELLTRRRIPHEILNAKNHEREAIIIAQAGKKGAVTISTNMAGRGVDIILGGDPPEDKEQAAVRELGGLHVIGTERHESRRIDNQLRGRSGRQGDPGSSRFYVALQDDLMRIFGGERVEGLMNRFGLDDSAPLEAGVVSKSIESAQKKVEGFNFDTRKRLVEMDDVMNEHREVVYKLRRRVLELSEGNMEHKEWFLGKLGQYTNEEFDKNWEELAEKLGEVAWWRVVGQMSLPVIDLMWMEHLVDMDHLRTGIGLRGYAQKDPMVEYKREGHERFEILVGQVYASIVERLSKISNVSEQPQPQMATQVPQRLHNVAYVHGEQGDTGVADEAKMVQQRQGAGNGGQGSSGLVRTASGIKQVEPVKSGIEKVGRNDLCPCGSGKKYKRCHGRA